MTTREAVALAENLSSLGGKHSVATRLVTMETQCRKASRLIRAALRDSNISLSDRVGWMVPYPSCGSDDTKVYYWKRATSREARFTPDY